MKSVVSLFLIFSYPLLASGLHAKTVDICFSPHGHCDQVLMSWINVSLKSIDAAIYGLTDENIALALVRAHKRGVRVRVIRDKVQAAGKHDVSAILSEADIPVKIQKGSRGGIMHHKFMVIDSQFVLTGSFNWTRNASARSDENFVVLDDKAKRFEREFERLWTRGN